MENILKMLYDLPHVPTHHGARYLTRMRFSRSRWYTNSRNRAYSTLVRGMNSSMPATPSRLPPTDTAASTQMDGRPTELPTTWG